MASQDKEGRYHVNIMVNGKRVHRILPKGATAGDAKRLEAELRVALAKQKTHRLSVPGDPPMTKILALFAEHTGGKGDTHAYLRLGPWAEKYRASQARDFAAHVIKDMRKVVDGKQVYADATINKSLSAAKKGLSLAWEKNLTPENYGSHIKVLELHNKREVFLSVEQVQSIAQHCSVEAQAAIWAALLTGARRGELFKLKPEYIGQDTLTFVAQTTKTKRTRAVPIVPALRPWLEHFPLTITIDGVKSAWRRARIKAGLEHVNFHDLRHSCASILLAHGVDLYTIGKILGHAHTNTTQRYAHLQVEQQRAALDKLSHLVLRS